MKNKVLLIIFGVVLVSVLGLFGFVLKPGAALAPEAQEIDNACKAVSSYNQLEIRRHFTVAALKWEQPKPMIPSLIAASAKQTRCSKFQVNTNGSSTSVKLEVNATDAQSILLNIFQENLNHAVLLALAGKTKEAEALWQEKVLSKLEGSNLPHKTTTVVIPLEQGKDHWLMTVKGSETLLNVVTGGLTSLSR